MARKPINQNQMPQEQAPAQGTPHRKRHNVTEAAPKKRKHPVLRGIAFFLVGLLLVCCGLAAYGWSLLSKMRIDPTVPSEPGTTLAQEDEPTVLEEMESDEVEPGAESLDEYVPTATRPPVELVKKDEEIINYLLVGLDNRKMTDKITGNTDVMIIMTMDKKNNKIKLTSLMRDILVDMPGQSSKKRLNSANSFLGIDGAIQLIEDTFGIPIDGFAAVNFLGVADAVNAMGGVTVEVEKNELGELNNCILVQKEQYGYKNISTVKKSGMQKLNGQQALAYMRIRHIAGGDFNRTARQRKVLRAVFDGVKDMNELQMVQLATQLTESVRTNLTEVEMLSAVANMYSLRNASLEELRLPLDNTYRNVRYNKMAVLDIDFEANSKAVKEFIYGK